MPRPSRSRPRSTPSNAQQKQEDDARRDAIRDLAQEKSVESLRQELMRAIEKEKSDEQVG